MLASNPPVNVTLPVWTVSPAIVNVVPSKVILDSTFALAGVSL